MNPSNTRAPSPGTASAISALAPLGIAAVAGLLYAIGFRDSTPWLLAGILGPFALGAGHVYAGNIRRGLGVGFCSYYAGVAGGLLGAGLWLVLGMANLGSLVLIPLITTGVVILAYYGWAIADAGRTAKRATLVHVANRDASQTATP